MAETPTEEEEVRASAAAVVDDSILIPLMVYWCIAWVLPELVVVVVVGCCFHKVCVLQKFGVTQCE